MSKYFCISRPFPFWCKGTVGSCKQTWVGMSGCVNILTWPCTSRSRREKMKPSIQRVERNDVAFLGRKEKAFLVGNQYVLMMTYYYRVSSRLQSFPTLGSFQMSVLCIRWPKYWSFSFSISPSSEYSGLIFFRIDWFDLLAVPGTLKSLLQHHSPKASILRHSAFFIIQLPLWLSW